MVNQETNIIERFSKLFQGYTKAHAVTRITGPADEKTGKVPSQTRTIHKKANREDYERHLKGDETGLCIYPLMDDNKNVKWACIDVDTYPVDFETLERDVVQNGYPFVITKTKSNGACLWLFFKQKISAAVVQVKLKNMAATLGLSKCEQNPKQTSRANAEEPGNGVNLPYFGDARKCFHQGKEIELESFLELAYERRTSMDALVKLETSGHGKDFLDGPPCLQSYAFDGCPDNYNNAMLNVAIYFRLKNPNTWREDTLEFNQRWPEPEKAGNIQKLLDGVEAKGYHYTCTKPPICDYCNFKECQKREFGVKAAGEAIVINKIVEFASDPPVYDVTINGKLVKGLDSTAMLSHYHFERRYFEQCRAIMPHVSLKQWKALIATAMENVLEVSGNYPEASIPGIMQSHLMTFINERAKFDEEQKDQILTGNVWIDKANVAHFAPETFASFLKLRSVLPKENKFYYYLHAIGCRKGETMQLKGRFIDSWYCNAPPLQNEEMNVKNYDDEDTF
ncbi:MAG: hypothetical protein GC179_30710 [Anaerolineaceae bacterium]|nr:hypothetical protein [Anaerolineaceae bacterium]